MGKERGRAMSIIDHNSAPEIPWRPNYRVWTVAGIDETTDCTLHYSKIEPGAGAPLHTHEVDELIPILDGQVEGRIGKDIQTVSSNHTMVIPKGIPHSFTASGHTTVEALAFFPCSDGMQNTHYLEGQPPEAYRTK